MQVEELGSLEMVASYEVSGARLRGILLATLPLPSAPAVPPRVSPCTYLRSLPTRPVDPTGHGAGQVITTPGNILSQWESGEKTWVYSLLVTILWHMPQSLRCPTGDLLTGTFSPSPSQVPTFPPVFSSSPKETTGTQLSVLGSPYLTRADAASCG